MLDSMRFRDGPYEYVLGSPASVLPLTRGASASAERVDPSNAARILDRLDEIDLGRLRALLIERLVPVPYRDHDLIPAVRSELTAIGSRLVMVRRELPKLIIASATSAPISAPPPPPVAPASQPRYAVRIQLRHHERLRYELEVAGQSLTGEIAAQGTLAVDLGAPTATGELRTWPARYSSLDEAGEEAIVWELDIGDLEPASSVRGAQCRLNNLGYQCGAEDGDLGPVTRSAIASFKHARRIEHDEDHLGALTSGALASAHGV